MDLYLFNEGTNHYAYRLMGAHFQQKDDVDGVRFCVWAPNAAKISVVGDFNGWDAAANPMNCIGSSGVWQTFVPGVAEYDLYKYHIISRDGSSHLKSDPYAFYSELRPANASRVYSLDGHEWGDELWQQNKANESPYSKPISIYEVHLGSWRRNEDGSFLNYEQMANQLVDYVVDMGYTHIEILPVAEHPFDGSWGYQTTGYFSVTSRYGTPHDFMAFVDRCHQKGIAVLLDWVPGHFPKDAHGLARFDGTALYEHEDPLLGEHPEWGTLIFNYGRHEVQSFLISNAIFWMDMYHIDGLRVDAVASMLYLDYGRKSWRPNRYGGRENLEAIDFMKKLNEAVYRDFPNTLMIAEESSTWPMVTKPTYLGGLGYNYKWNMGWMNDILSYVEMDPIHRKWYHERLTFSMMYAFSENFILPLSHDEVVHGKHSLLDKAPGDYWRKFAGLRLLLGYMMAHPGKKLLFMGGEFGQFIEWKFDDSLDWHLLGYEMHQKLHEYVRELNHMYLAQKSLWEIDDSWDGFQWIDPHDYSQSIISFIRRAKEPGDWLAVICNFTPVVHEDYRIGIPLSGEYEELLNSDEERYGGSGQKNVPILQAEELPWHKLPYSLSIKVPPLAVLYLRPLSAHGWEGGREEIKEEQIKEEQIKGG